MKSSNVVVDKSYSFAVRTVKLCRYLADEKHEDVLSRLLLRSGTSVGANIEEAEGAFTDNDFSSRFTIAYKECRETRFWLKLLKDTDYLTEKQAVSMLNDCEELLKIIGSIQKTLKEKRKKN